MPYLPKPETLLRRWEQAQVDDPAVSLEQFACAQIVPLHACISRLDTARRAREINMRQITKAGAVTTIEFDVCEGWEHWILLQSDNHHDSIYCNRQLEKEHLDLAQQRGAYVLIFGDVFDAMQGRHDPRRSLDELRPEYKREQYYDSVIDDAANFYGEYADTIKLLADGNHELIILKNSNTNILDRLAKEINIRGGDVLRGGYGGWVRLVFRDGDKRVAKNIKYYHGSGGEAPVTRGVIQTNRQAVYLPDADIVANGHSHNMYYVPISRERLSPDGRHYFDMQHHIRIPGYKQSYGDGTGGWDVTRGGVPKPIGAVWVNLAYSDGDVRISVMADIRGAEPVGVAQDVYGGIVFPQDGEGV